MLFRICYCPVPITCNASCRSEVTGSIPSVRNVNHRWAEQKWHSEPTSAQLTDGVPASRKGVTKHSTTPVAAWHRRN